MTNSTKITTYLLSVFFLLGAGFSYAQCGGTPVSNVVTTPYWKGDGQNDTGVPIPDMSSGQYALVNVIKGIEYEINARYITVCNGAQEVPLSANYGSWFSPRRSFIAPISGEVRVYYTGGSSGVRIKIIGGVNNADTRDVAPNENDKWRVHFYREADNFTNYLGYSDYNESFREARTPENPIPIRVYSQGSERGGVLRYFSAKALMRTSRKGLYYIKLGADDGTRLYINETKVYDNWNPSYYSPTTNQIVNLTANDLLKYEYYNNNVPLEFLFEISDSDKIIENIISGEQTLCIDNDNGTPITGDDFNRRTQRGFNPTFAFQWAYTTSIDGKLTDIDGATQKDFTPNTQTAPFNQAGTYYLYRRASVTFKNIGMSPKTESVTSNPVKIIVLNKPTAKAKPSKKSFCQGESDAKITVTVNNGSGGQPPFTFHYKIDGVTQQHQSNEHIFEIPINTNQAGEFHYQYTSVTDDNGCTNQLNLSDIITIRPLPTAVFSGQNTTLCLNTPAAQIPWVTFTGELPFTSRIRAAKTGNPPIEFNDTSEENENRLIIGHTPNDEGEFTYELLWVSDKNGCKTFFTNQKLIVNVVKPSISLTTPENITWCLPEIVSAVYDEGSGHTNVSENSYVLPSRDTTLDVVINPVPCCPNPVLKWTINNDLSNVRTGQPSTHTGISFENATSTDKTYNITYWLECNGQKYNYITRQVRITPRPVLQFE